MACDTKSISVIPNSEEEFIGFSKYILDRFQIKFIDTSRLISASLEKLACNLSSDKSKFRETIKVFKEGNLDLVTRKGSFPYEYCDDWSTLDETALPPIDKFYTSLTELTISPDDYERAKYVWNKFGIKTLGEYSDWYLMVDVLLLTDVFENFRDLCMQTYGLDPCYYYTAHGRSFDCML